MQSLAECNLYKINKIQQRSSVIQLTTQYLPYFLEK